MAVELRDDLQLRGQLIRPPSFARRPRSNTASEWRRLKLAAFSVDVLCIVGIVTMSSWLTSRFDSVGVGALIVLTWSVVLAACGSYRPEIVAAQFGKFTLLARVVVVATVSVLAGSALFDLGVSRAWILTTAAVAFVILGGERMILGRTVAALRAQGHLARRMIVAGDSGMASLMVEPLRRSGFDVVGYVGAVDAGVGGGSVRPVPEKCAQLGRLDEVVEVATRAGATTVLLTPGAVSERASDGLVDELGAAGLEVVLSAGVPGLDAARLRVGQFDSIATLRIVPAGRLGWRRAAKRAVDLVGATVGLVLVAPFLAVVVIAIKLDSKGPAIFRQVRVGMHGRRFSVCKLRTMTEDAEAQLVELRLRNEAPGPLFKMRDDPRVTRVGRLLRRISFDEVPQFWNVLRGDMSLIGPRPALPTEMESWDAEAHTRLRARPGITGLWQVRGGDADTFDDYVRLDRYYVQNWSLWLDLRIACRTIPAILCSRRT